jgi:hypothetical protein
MASKALAPKYDSDFILSADNSKDFGIIPKIGTWTHGAIRLRKGKQNREFDDYGAAHIERGARIGQIRKAGYTDARAIVADVAKNYDAIYEKKNGKVLEIYKKSNNAMVYLRKINDDSGSYYDVYTAVIKHKTWGKTKKPLWEKPNSGFQSSGKVVASPPQQNKPPTAITGIPDTSLSSSTPEKSSTQDEAAQALYQLAAQQVEAEALKLPLLFHVKQFLHL